MADGEKRDETKRPVHSIEPDGRHAGDGKKNEVEAPKARVDDEVGSDEPKRTRRQE